MSIEIAILITAFVSLVALGVPIAFVLGLACLLAVIASGGPNAAMSIASDMTNGIDSFTLLAIPFFIVAGEIIGASGVAKRLVNFALALVGRLPGGLALVNTLTCMLFGALTGSAAAAITTVGGFMVPEMKEQGYSEDFSTALTVTAGTTGLVIPPSNIMIVYAVAASNVSVAAMFMAGIIPGILVGLCIGVLCLFSGGKQYSSSRSNPIAKILSTGFAAMPGLLLAVFVLGSIIGGICTATEAAALAVAYALLLWFAEASVAQYKTGSSVVGSIRQAMVTVFGKGLTPLLIRSVRVTSIVLLLIATSRAISVYFAFEQIPQQLSDAMLALSSNPIVLLLLINLILLAVGTFMDMTPAVLIFTPILLPVAGVLGVDPVHFGIIMIVNLCIGLCTPPVGTCLFLGCSVTKRSIMSVSKAMLPLYVAMIAALLLITYIPGLSLWLPQLID